MSVLPPVVYSGRLEDEQMPNGESWVGAGNKMRDAVASMLQHPAMKKVINAEHCERTPDRVVDSYNELFSGVTVDPSSVLKTSFSDDYDEMVLVNNIQFVSVCAHHWLPFLGKAHFAYIPNKSIVGISKIPRLIDVLARRPQVQEKLTKEIVKAFQDAVHPKGCALVMEAYHLCMAVRGVKKETAYTKTNWLEGVFRKPEVRAEFFECIRKNGENVWP